MSSSPPAKQPKHSCPIHHLADTDLSGIFKWLPPFERLIVSEVCRRWHEISRKSWLDIKTIDLGPIPGRHIGAILQQCPNLQSVFAASKSFDLKALTCLPKSHSLTCVRFFGCDFASGVTQDIVMSIFSDRLVHSALVELILHDALFCTAGPLFVVFGAQYFPVTLTHLQLSGLRVTFFTDQAKGLFLNGLEKLVNLECFILCSTPDRQDASDELTEYDYAQELTEDAFGEADILAKIVQLENLREFCIGPAVLLDWTHTSLTNLLSGLPKLEVLLLYDADGEEIAEGLADLIETDSALRILVLSGEFDNKDVEPEVADEADVDEKIVLPARKRFPNGFGSEPLPLLHIFVGREASERIIFEKSPSDAAIIHPINAPMPEFLKRADIAPIFEGVWVAERIKEVAENGGRLWNYELYDDASLIQQSAE